MGTVHFDRSKKVADNSLIPHNGQDTDRKTDDPIRLSHFIAFNIKENKEQISGILTIDFDYYSLGGSIKYRAMNYSDPRLIKHIEGNPSVMKNIDSYIRRNLLEFEYGFGFKN